MNWLPYGWDYYSGTSWLGIRDEVMDLLPQDGVIKAKRMQYRGNAGECWFAGEGFQPDKHGVIYRHFLLSVSGSLADRMREVGDILPGATRLDMQITAKAPEKFSLRALAWGLQNRAYGSFNRRGRYPHVSFISSDTVTLYIGKRGKGRMIRIYEKFCSGGIKYIRFEVEYAADTAKAYQRETSDRQVVEAIRGEFHTLPVKARLQMQFVEDALAESYEGSYRLQAKDRERDTFAWLISAMSTGQKLELDKSQRMALKYACCELSRVHQVSQKEYEEWLKLQE